MEIEASFYNQEVAILSTPEGGIYGCYLAIKHAKDNIDYADLLKTDVQVKKVWMPEKELNRKYSEIYKKYRNICSQIEDFRR